MDAAAARDRSKDVSTPPPPPQPRRVGAGRKIEGLWGGANGSIDGTDDDGPKPLLPPRPVDLLGGDTGEMGGWEALKPN